MLDRTMPDITNFERSDITPISPSNLSHYPNPEGVLQRQSRRFLSPIFFNAFALIIMLALVVLWEQFSPYDYKISVLLGKFSGTTAAANLKAQTEVRLEYEGKLKALDEVLQTNVAKNQAEMQAYMANLGAMLQRVNEAYSAMYQRGNTIAANMAQAQREFMSLRNQMTASGQGGAVAAANMAGFVGGFLDVFGGQQNQYAAQQFYEKADEINRRTRSQIDETADVPAPFLKIQGWNDGLISPNEFMNMTNGIASDMIKTYGQNNAFTPKNPLELRPYAPIAPMP